jgi:pimeloyl-ACP methyl ester carboxylesterase
MTLSSYHPAPASSRPSRKCMIMMVSDSLDPWIEAPSEALFRASFDGITPPVSFVTSAQFGKTAYYLLKPISASLTITADTQPELPILLIHGGCTPALGMMPIARGLQQKLPNSTILLIDLFGHGLSSSPKVPHTADLAHQQILSLLDHLGWSSVHIAGYSLGGSIAITFTASHRHLIRSVFLIAPAGMIREEQFSQGIIMDDLIDKSREGKEAAESEKRILDWLEGAPIIDVPLDWKEQTQRGQLVAPALRQWQRDNHKGHIASILSFLRNQNIHDRDEDFRKVAKSGVPIMAILGGQDDLIDTDRLDSVALHQHQTLLHATHGLSRDNANEVVEVYVVFLNSIGVH